MVCSGCEVFDGEYLLALKQFLIYQSSIAVIMAHALRPTLKAIVLWLRCR